MTTVTPVRGYSRESTVLGSSVGRLDTPPKMSGRAEFTGDIEVPGMVHGSVLRSPYAHALIRTIDSSVAENMPGVVAVLTREDLMDIDPYYGHAIRDRPIVAFEKVRFVGEPIAAVAAETAAQAEAAMLQMEVDYEELPVAASLEAALAVDAPLLHGGELRPGAAHGLGNLPDRAGNVCYSYFIDRGDLELAEATADIVIDREYNFPAVYQYSMETHSVIAQHDGEEIRLWASCQHPFLVRAEIAKLFDLPVDRVRITVPYLGGGFGSKSYTKMEPLAVALARKAERPVKIVNRVDESMITTRRHNMNCRMRTMATSDGELLGREVELWLDTGAYADNGPRVAATAGDAAPGPYRWPSFKVDASCVYTNTGPSGSYRAFGATHLQWIGESQIDEVARAAGIDPLEIRNRSLLCPGEEVRARAKPLDADLIGDVNKAAVAIGWGRERIPNRGMGVSVGLLAAGAHPVSMATVKMDATGSVTLLVGSTEMGQGTRTVMAQIVAEVLTVPVTSVFVDGADTRFTPYDRSTGASRSTTVAGLAVKRAAEDVLDSLLETALEIFDLTDEAELDIQDGSVSHGSNSMTMAEIITSRFGFVGGELIGNGEVKPEGGSGSYEEGPVFWEVCVAAAEIEVDRATGVVRVLQTATVADVGTAINPLLIKRQDEGATLQGIGNALLEEMVYTEDGNLLNDTLLDYRVPTTLDLPDKMTCILVENNDGPGPFGAKGCGEGALAAVPAAIVNALADAGIPTCQLPITPERVWQQIQLPDNDNLEGMNNASIQ
jgi:CO/xanthine dehydrogenase Mo-binding subunit|tara:strand:+ start:6952 stop:9288 length:2337 start_codon:yes stop_codon:yes gene_type:complete